MGAGLGLVQIASSWPDSHRVELKRHWDQTLTQKSVDDPSESNWRHGMDPINLQMMQFQVA